MRSNSNEQPASNHISLQVILRQHGWWIAVLTLTLCWRAVLLLSNAVSFHSDEAIVGLMARHILRGQAIPVFFYGQAYMGSLDPLLVSVMFRLMGETVMGIRLVQAGLYVLTVGTAMLLAYTTSKNRWIATMTGLLLALPTPLVSLYTTISLGGYGETLLLGNLVMWLGWQIAAGKPGWWRWAALGGLAGVGWWTNNLIVVYLLPVGLFVLLSVVRSKRSLSPVNIAVAGLAFLIGSVPWWVYNFTHDWESVRFLLGGFQSAAGSTTASVGITDRLIGFLLLGLPAVLGVRYSWTFQMWAGPLALAVLIAYVVCLVLTFRRPNVALYWWMLAGIAVIFVLSSFGIDSTGRYLLPITVSLAILVASGTSRLPVAWQRFLPIAVILAVNLVGTLGAMRSVPPGLTPQFDPATDFTNNYDQQAIAFLRENGGTLGYATYWASYRLAFLSGETVLLSPQLPYKASLVYSPTDRYPAYTTAAEKADRPVLVSANLPQLDQAIVERLTTKGIRFSQRQIGPYTIFFDLSQPVNPAELGLQSLH